MKSNLKSWLLPVGAAALAMSIAATVVLVRKKAPQSLLPSHVLIAEIKSQPNEAGGTMPDVVMLSDGERITDIGYDLTQVGSITLASGQPIYLLKSFTCRNCEADIKLVILSPSLRKFEILPYPGEHLLLHEAIEQEVPDFVVEGRFGHCGSSEYRLFLATKKREVDFDGMSVRIGEAWEYSFQMFSFLDDGQISKSTESRDGFSELQRLDAGDCVAIEPEDRMDYL